MVSLPDRRKAVNQNPISVHSSSVHVTVTGMLGMVLGAEYAAKNDELPSEMDPILKQGDERIERVSVQAHNF